MIVASDRLDSLVVGAGIGGLAYAWRARLRGERVQVLEASARPGGVIATVVRAGYRIERAATSIPASASHLRTLLNSLPSQPVLEPSTQAQTQWLWTRSGLQRVPRSPLALLTSPLLSLGARVRLFAEVLRSPRRVVGSETLESFVQRRFGRGVAQTFLHPFTSGVYGAHPWRLGAADAFPHLVAMEQRSGSILRALGSRARGQPRDILCVRGGTQRLVEALADALGSSLRTSSPVTSLQPAANEQDPGVTLASGERVQAREVVLAIPAHAQARLLEPHVPDVAAMLGSVATTALAVIAVGLPPSNGPRLPAGFGMLKTPRVQARILGATFNSNLSPDVAPAGHELVTVYAGGSEDPGFLDLSDRAIQALVVRDLSRALGRRIVPDLVDIWRWPHAIPRLGPGHRGRMAAAQQASDAHGVRLLGSHCTGVSLDQCVRPRPRAGELCS